MLGLMQDWSLTLDKIISYAAAEHGHAKIFYRDARRQVHVTDYVTILERSRRFSAALIAHGIRLGDRVTSLMWNNPDHIVAWYGTMSIGSVLHTLNPRLGEERLIWLINRSAARILVIEEQFLTLIAAISSKIPSVERVIVAGDLQPQTVGSLSAMSFGDFLRAGVNDETVPWGEFDENTAAGLCFTSGTTGDPKGVLYSHRSNFLHGFMINQASAFALTSVDTVLPIVPMFHANAWALIFAAPMAGAALALPGPFLDGASLSELINLAGVTFSAGVPTVFGDLLRHLQLEHVATPTFKRMVVGGSALTDEIINGFAEDRGVDVIHAWGMTELSPLGTVSRYRPGGNRNSRSMLLRQGQAIYPVQAVILDANGNRCPHDDETPGFLNVSGPTVVKRYFGQSSDVLTAQGYFDTGDIAIIDATGSIKIVDRAKDVIKSGGEWISSIELEDAALSHPTVKRAAVIAVPHEKWAERPLLIVEPVDGEMPEIAAIMAHIASRVPRWWLPEKTIVRSIPLGPTGKIDKLTLRTQLAAEENTILPPAA